MNNQAEDLLDYKEKTELKCVNDSHIILYHNGEYCIFNGPIEEAIEYVKSDRRYNNYGHNGATIVSYRKRYTIKDDAVEISFT